jgi:hypothetical protein
MNGDEIEDNGIRKQHVNACYVISVGEPTRQSPAARDPLLPVICSYLCGEIEGHQAYPASHVVV